MKAIRVHAFGDPEIMQLEKLPDIKLNSGQVVVRVKRETASIYPALLAGLENQTLCPVVGQEMPLADASLAHIAVMEPGSKGKIVLIP